MFSIIPGSAYCPSRPFRALCRALLLTIAGIGLLCLLTLNVGARLAVPSPAPLRFPVAEVGAGKAYCDIAALHETLP